MSLLHPEISVAVLNDVLTERARQDDKWGEQNHSLPIWQVILDEEVGEFANAILRKTFDSHDTKDGELGTAKAVERCREEAIQIAAVAVAIVECLDRWKTRREKAL